MEYYLNIRNKSHYITETSKVNYRIINPKLFISQQNKQFGYYVRMYYHYRHVLALGGQCYFYTLTYNDKALPRFMGIPCFNHSTIQQFFRSSGFDKKLLRDYGMKLQYFVSCELGEGKGQRGINNNPHYHVIFFLTPTGDFTKQKMFGPSVFQELVRDYWCGPRYINGRRVNPKDYRYGIAMPGDNLGVIDSPKALSYVSKYVLKDTVYFKLYNSLKQSAKLHILERLKKMSKAVYLYRLYCKESIDPWNDSNVQRVLERLFNRLYKKDIMRLHVPKVRISQGVGLYALEHINDDGVTISVPFSTGVQCARIPLYLYRKKYYDVVKDFVGNNKYVLNKLGIQLQVDRLPKTLETKFNEIKPLIDYYKVDGVTDDILHRYCIYDTIYRDRFCPDINIEIDFKGDYSCFLLSEYFQTNYTDDIDSSILMSEYRHKFLLYSDHLYFCNYVNIFKKIDNMLSEHYICANEKKQQDYNDIMRVKSLFSTDKFKKYVSSL